MTEYTLLFLGLVIGMILGYFLLKYLFVKNYVPKFEFDELNTKFNNNQFESASKITKSEISENYVSKDLYLLLQSNLESANTIIEESKVKIDNNQKIILSLTAETEQKISKKEIEQNYVAKESYEIVQKMLLEIENELKEKNDNILLLNNRLTDLKNKEDYLNEKLETFKSEIENLHNTSQERFKNIATELLEQKKNIFVEENKKELNTILEPLTTNLNQFKEKIEATRKEDIQDLTSLKKEIESLQKLNLQLSDDARDLANALKSDVKMQGNWGEDRLNMILEVEGLQKYIDFTREEVHRDDEQDRIRRPDFILKLPNDKHIIIDSKVSLTAYVNYYNAENPSDKNEFLKQHLKSVTDHINNLADKNYQSLLGLNTPDYIFMFMPVESALTLAMNQNSDIFNIALKRKIVLITPTTLVATLKVVKILWQKENQVKNIEKIFDTCGSLYDKFVGFIEDMEKIDTGIKSVSNSYNNAMNKLTEGKRKGDTIIGKFEAIKNLEAKVNKRIPEKYINEVEIFEDRTVQDEIESHEIVNLLDPANNEQN